jgi:hypothetical protein
VNLPPSPSPSPEPDRWTSAVRVHPGAQAGAYRRRGVHRGLSRCRRCAGPCPRGGCSGFASPSPVCLVDLSRRGPFRAPGRRVPPSWCTSPPSSVGVDGAAAAGADRGRGAHVCLTRCRRCGRRRPRESWSACSSPAPLCAVDLSRWDRSRIPARRGSRCSRAWRVSRCRPSAGRRRRGCGSGCSSWLSLKSAVGVDHPPLTGADRGAGAHRRLLSAVGVHGAAAGGPYRRDRLHGSAPFVCVVSRRGRCTVHGRRGCACWCSSSASSAERVDT